MNLLIFNGLICAVLLECKLSFKRTLNISHSFILFQLWNFQLLQSFITIKIIHTIAVAVREIYTVQLLTANTISAECKSCKHFSNICKGMPSSHGVQFNYRNCRSQALKDPISIKFNTTFPYTRRANGHNAMASGISQMCDIHSTYPGCPHQG